MSYGANARIKWFFNSPGAPWMGGAWERLVGLTKKEFYKPLMCTITCRIEAILNTRPLTKLNSTDLTEIPLKPVDFLRGNFRWSTEYLSALSKSQKSNLKQPRHLTRMIPVEGELVLIEEDLLPRGSWSYGKVVETIKSADDLCRSAQMMLPNRKIIQRPLNKLFPLEIRSLPDTRT
ncbi:unnamed protein product, partial [Cylicostephanus goldi]